jgi:hypothetical protein
VPRITERSTATRLEGSWAITPAVRLATEALSSKTSSPAVMATTPFPSLFELLSRLPRVTLRRTRR